MNRELTDEELKYIKFFAEEFKLIHKDGFHTTTLAGMISDFIDLKIALAFGRLSNSLKD